MKFLIAHWRGELSLTKSFLLNFLVGYIAVVTLLVATGESFDFLVGLMIFLAWLVWALVGVSRSAVKVLRDDRSPPVRKGFAVLALAVVVVVVVLSVGDAGRLFP